MTKRKKAVIRWLVFILLAYFVTRPMYYPGVGNHPSIREESIRLLQKGDMLSPDETDRFLISWSELLEKDFNNDKIISLLKSNENPRKILSPRVKRWIEIQGWNFKRFFFVGRRVQKIVDECHKIQKAMSKRESLEVQMNQTKDESIIGTIRKIIDDDSQISKGILQEEIDIIMPKLMIIEGILKGELAYKPER